MARTYLVGGAVRDDLLGVTGGDRDWVVVGATPTEMLEAGFVPVGRDFPVFLHPQTHEEHALARTERKTAPGYHGFSFHADPSVTLEDDLARRDLTVNAMARDEHGALIDPYGGARDLRDGVLRHVGEAFVEDPVRILRLARFAARLPEFRVADETAALMRRMVQAGEVDALVPERVWQELSRGLMEARPSRAAMSSTSIRCTPLSISGWCSTGCGTPNRRSTSGSRIASAPQPRSTLSLRSRCPPCGSISAPASSCAIALIVKSRRSKSSSSVTDGSACTSKPR